MRQPPFSTSMLGTLASRWRWRRMIAATMFLLATLAPLEVLLIAWTSAPAWWLPSAVGAVLAAVWMGLRGRPAEESLVRHLDRVVTDLEESSELLLSPVESLLPLQRLQKRRALEALARLELREVPLAPFPSKSFGRLAGLMLAACIAVWLASPRTSASVPAGFGEESVSRSVLPAPSLSVAIRPPAYTGLEPIRESLPLEAADLSIVEGSSVTWMLSGLAGREATLVFDDEELPMTPLVDGIEAGATRRVVSSHLYYFAIAAAEGESGSVERSPFARLQVTLDEVPDIAVAEPPPFLLLPPDGSDRLVVTAEISDDYSVESTALVATVASGAGELVEFRERRFSFPRLDGNSRRGSHARVFDLSELGVVPGSELYFYLEATDNKRPTAGRGRSATRIVRRSGGSGASIGLGDGIPVFAVPDLFRSQRQIILDTERLLKEAPAIARREFERRCQQIGFDQRALRLRYGVLLGQEIVDGQQLSDEEQELEFEDDEDLGDLVMALPEGMVHEHDPQDLNTFFDSEVRDRMKAALREMWGAEGRLRSNEPRPALPFEYRALTLLKQAQERSRIYVQKVGFEPPPLYPEEKRLTGDLGKLRDRSPRRESLGRVPSPVELILDELERFAAGELEGERAVSVLRAARRELLEGALENSASDLGGLEAAARLEVDLAAGGATDRQLLDQVRRELWRRLPEPQLLPGDSPFRGSSAFERYLAELSRPGPTSGGPSR